MEKPDANGFVNINWPSKTIPHGGIFHSRTAQSSEDQQQFLKVLLEESKLTIAQRRQSALALREHEKRTERRPQVQTQLVRPRTSRRRSLSEIRQSGAFDLDSYMPRKRGEDREKMIQKLANLMAYGDTPEQAPPKPIRESKPAPKLPTKKEMWHDLVTQIRERAEWLDEMEFLGEAGPHRDIIKDQIAERMKALDKLGIDSICSTARSSASGFSTLRSREIVQYDRGTEEPPRSGSKHCKIADKLKSVTVSKKKQDKEENVRAYNQLTTLQYSPRRRV
ncbi:hypothetical protein evm_009395 [Chilo suppressalis]|nr:hypothetical protein evm_009395 [Chilo suppressalis]